MFNMPFAATLVCTASIPAESDAEVRLQCVGEYLRRLLGGGERYQRGDIQLFQWLE